MFYGFLTAEVEAGVERRVTVLESRLRAMVDLLLPTVEVDEAWYLLTNPDVEDAIAAGTLLSGREHYQKHGYYEDRFPRPILVDSDFYLHQYTDVRQAIDAGVFFTAEHHFSVVGFREGRLPYAGFSLFGPARDTAGRPPQPGVAAAASTG